MQRFAAAPWPRSLQVLSGVGTILLLVVWFGAEHGVPPRGAAHWVGTFMIWLPPVLLFGALLFTVSGYEIGPGELRVQRLFWSTVIPLEGTVRAWQDPQAVARSLKIFGNAGLYAFTGLYRSKALGRYRLYATDPSRAVIVQFSGRTVIVTPETPYAFVRCLSQAAQGFACLPLGGDAPSITRRP